MSQGLGRVPSPPDDRDYRMGALLFGSPIPRKRLWHVDRVLNQRDSCHCVGFAWAAWGLAVPIETQYTDRDAHRIYERCKVVDGEPGVENGSTVRSGAQVMRNAGRIHSYYFGNFRESLEFVGNRGTCVIGIPWYTDMRNPPDSGIIRPTGEITGGHCILWRGIEWNYAILRSSWGVGWGIGGDCRILLTDLEKLMDANGEACAAVEAPAPPSLLSRVLSYTRR